MNDKITNWTKADDAMVETAIRRGATRRELLQLMLAGGVATAAGGFMRGYAGFRRRPESGRLVVLHRRYTRSSQGVALHRLCALLRLL